MNPTHSSSLVLVWLVAQFEARHLKASTLGPTHLLLGLCKIVDVDLPDLVSRNNPDRDAILEESLREVRKLRNVFRTAGVDAKLLRRNLRKAWPERRFELDETERLRRNPAAKRAFTDAEQFAEITGGIVYPAHLLYATLLADDKHRDTTFEILGIDKQQFLSVAKRQAGLVALDAASGSKKPRSRWN